MMQQFFIPGPLPGANDIVRKHFRVYSLLKLEWGNTCAAYIRKAKLKPMGPCHIAFHWSEPHSKRDIDNIMFGQKFVLDALRDTKVIQDDNRHCILSIRHTVAIDEKNPGVQIILHMD